MVEGYGCNSQSPGVSESFLQSGVPNNLVNCKQGLRSSNWVLDVVTWKGRAEQREADPGKIAPLAGMVSVPTAMVSFLLHNCDRRFRRIPVWSSVEAEVEQLIVTSSCFEATRFRITSLTVLLVFAHKTDCFFSLVHQHCRNPVSFCGYCKLHVATVSHFK
ncbi:hypothetical protein NP493_402g02040 [Ridgeia piscesae]|uniref:Uncharacterized protein n=1 Tax=Ridgeia piscesae TaxID=27915 RepID=A0AAD9L2C8_RIDPI|nr:hypothetical protein NP493_402g02040 [Ridgeia piscesae]